MADALISVVLQQLSSTIQTEIQQEARLLFGAQGEAEKLSKTLTAIRGVLNDAEKKQVKEDNVKLWLEEIEAVSYDLEDVLDEWNTRIHASDTENKKMVAVRLPKFISPCFCFNQTLTRHDVGNKMKRISERLDVIAKEKDRYKFDLGLGGKSEELERLETTPLIDVSEVCGREMDKDTVVNKLCDCTPDENGPLVVSIVGFGGMGKTTLAQLAFNDERVSNHFEFKIWVCVSESFDKTQIASEILDVVDIVHPFSFWSHLQDRLHKSIEGKKFLLVLDDVWTDDFRMWEPIMVALKSGALGSRILVTTRNERVSRMMKAAYILPLGGLSPEDSWTLFRRLAFYGKSTEDCDILEEIGRKIADRCKGLPLAVKTVGGLMCFKETRQAWENVLGSELWELEEVERGIFPPLLLSYYDLPSPIKRCFTYCSIFPKDHKIEKQILIQHWMAQGFLVPTGSVAMEQKGAEYFDNLVMRSFFQDLERDIDDPSKVTCKMHGIVHDFARFLTKNGSAIIDLKNDRLRSEARHVTLIGPMDHIHPLFCNLKNLRTLQLLQKDVSLFPSNIFHGLTSIRVLDLSHTSIARLPREVGKLLHLRLLNLSSLALEELPSTISNLYNLQTLNLDFCKRLHTLPGGLVKLINLRYLNIKETECLSILPQGIGRLSALRTLSKFVVSENRDGCSVEELKNLNHLEGHLVISGLEKVTEVDKVREADLIKKKHLRSLDLVFSFGVQEVMENVIEALQPHPDLEVLEVYDYGGSVLPSWITWLTKLKDLRLLSFGNCRELPPLGKLPSLEKLLVGHFNILKHVGAEFLGVDSVQDSAESVVAFPKLKALTFRFMVEWESWDTGAPATVTPKTSNCSESSSRGGSCNSSIVTNTNRKVMPCLRSLSLYDCPKLQAIPPDIQLMPLEELIITRCPILEQRSTSFTAGSPIVDLP